MKKAFLPSLILIFVLFISCNDFYKTAQNHYKLGEYDLAEIELSKIKESDSEYKKVQLLRIKIDSSIYENALKEFLNDNLDKSTEILKDIKANSVIHVSKIKLLKKIKRSNDSSFYQKSLEQYHKNNLGTSKGILKNIENNSPFFTKKNKLLSQISRKDDSTKYEQALKKIELNYLERAIELLEDINPNSIIYKKKSRLLKKIAVKIKLNAVKEKYISKAVISSIFGQSPRIMKVKVNDSGIYIVSYYSRDSRRNYSYKVKFEGYYALWGADNGRWKYDNIYYSETKDAYYITEKYSDGSKRKDKFYKRNLK